MEIKSVAMYEQALNFRARRNEVLASNIANADTPNYKSRDMDFREALKGAQSGSISMKKTSELHQNTWNSQGVNANLKYRVPTQPTLDGNTVETDVEQAAFAENAVQYRASLAFLDGHLKTLKFALKGGD
ncbi:MAG: flagellar basal body rod protein FlgB [Gammaproteobacteria bacterium]|nr:flagellar basal body rod protein FlgB [Gammaproteobacteria bacterium]